MVDGNVRFVPKADIVHLVGAVKEPGAVGVGIAVATLAKGTSVILVLNQYKCIGCSPGKCPDTRTVATASDEDSRGSTVVYALLFSRVSGCQDEIGIACVECSSTQGQGHC
jgi:hypothetical protein